MLTSDCNLYLYGWNYQKPTAAVIYRFYKIFVLIQVKNIESYFFFHMYCPEQSQSLLELTYFKWGTAIMITLVGYQCRKKSSSHAYSMISVLVNEAIMLAGMIYLEILQRISQSCKQCSHQALRGKAHWARKTEQLDPKTWFSSAVCKLHSLAYGWPNGFDWVFRFR